MPDPDFFRAGAAADHLDAVGDHEGGIETDAELADQRGALLAFREALDECARARAGDGAEIVDQLLPIHADAGIGDGERPRLGIGPDTDEQRSAFFQQFRARNGIVAQPVAGI